MEIKFTKQELLELVREEVSRLGAVMATEQGASLYDALRITSRDEDAIARMISEAKSTMKTQCHRFLTHTKSDSTDSVIFSLNGSERRFDGKQDIITTYLQQIMTNMVVLKYLQSKTLSEAAKSYDEKAAAMIELLSSNLYTKLPPKK